MVLTAAIQADAVESYYYSGVVSEYKCSFGTVLVVWYWLVSPLGIHRVSSVNCLSVVMD